MSNETQVQTTPGSALMGNVERGDSLKSGFDPNDLLIPRAMLLQFTPPKSLDVDYASGKHRAGMVINSLTLEELPKTFIPVFVRTKWIRFNAQEATKPGYDSNFELGAKIWESNNPLDPRVQSEGQWGPNNEPPLASKFLEFFCVFEGVSMPVIMSFTKTSLDAGKQLLTLAQFGGAHMFSKQYELGVKKEVNKQQQAYFILTVKPAGSTDEGKQSFCKTLFDTFSNAKLRVDERDEHHDTESTKRPF